MAQIEEAYAAIRRIYDAVLTPSEWEQPVASIATAVGAPCALLVAAQDGAPTLTASTGLEARFANGFRHEFLTRVPDWVKAIPIGVARQQSSAISDADFKRTHIYREVVKPAEMFYGIVLPLASSDARQAYFATGRELGAADFHHDDLSALALIAPHLTAALNIHCRLANIHLRANGAYDVLMQLRFGVILIDADARPVFVNPSAESICRAADGLSITHREVTARVPADAKALRNAISAALRMTVTRQHRKAHESHLDATLRCYISRTPPQPQCVVQILPIAPSDSAGGIDDRVRAALFVFDPSLASTIDRTTIAKTFDLTPRESQLSALLVRGIDVVHAAREMGIGSETARGYLKDIYLKTQTHRQAELVALLLRGRLDSVR